MLFALCHTPATDTFFSSAYQLYYLTIKLTALLQQGKTAIRIYLGNICVRAVHDMAISFGSLPMDTRCLYCEYHGVYILTLYFYRPVTRKAVISLQFPLYSLNCIFGFVWDYYYNFTLFLRWNVGIIRLTVCLDPEPPFCGYDGGHTHLIICEFAIAMPPRSQSEQQWSDYHYTDTSYQYVNTFICQRFSTASVCLDENIFPV